MNDFDGLVAVVTGGASGIGAASVDLLLAKGARVAVLDRTVSTNPSVLSVACDITSELDVKSAIAAVAEKLGGIDILINNAGIGASGNVAANSDAEWQRVFDVNVFGMVRVTRAALPYLLKSGSASIVNTCSIVASIGVPERALYSATKGAMVSLTLAMAADHVRDFVRVNGVLPGTADTPWVARLLAAADDASTAEQNLKSRQPLGRLVTASEVANAIVYLASPLSSSTTGTLLTVDGGMGSLRIPQAVTANA